MLDGDISYWPYRILKALTADEVLKSYFQYCGFLEGYRLHPHTSAYMRRPAAGEKIHPRHPSSIGFMMFHCAALVALAAVPAVVTQQATFVTPLRTEPAPPSYEFSEFSKGHSPKPVKNVGTLRVTENSGVCGVFRDYPINGRQ